MRVRKFLNKEESWKFWIKFSISFSSLSFQPDSMFCFRRSFRFSFLFDFQIPLVFKLSRAAGAPTNTDISSQTFTDISSQIFQHWYFYTDISTQIFQNKYFNTDISTQIFKIFQHRYSRYSNTDISTQIFQALANTEFSSETFTDILMMRYLIKDFHRY